MRLTLRYFASLRDAAGIEAESVEHEGDACTLYAAAASRHGFAMPRERIRIAVNGSFASWNHVLRDGDEVVFLPPVSGG